VVGLLAWMVVACSAPGAGAPTERVSAAATTSAAAPTSASASGSVAAPSAKAATPKPGEPFACGELECRTFATPTEALTFVLEKEKPLVLGLGESHAQKGDPKVPSTTARFTKDFLPVLAPQTSSLVLELWVADGSCGKATEKKVAEQQKAVTKNQAEENPNEFLALGNKSKELGVVPFILRPSCKEVETIKAAGDDAPLKMLDMITAGMTEQVKKRFAETKGKQPGKMVLTYGGAMHNDVAPRKGREAWSFAGELTKLSEGRYVELDLIVPEFIKPDSPSWQGQPWFAAYDREAFGATNVLVQTGQRAYTLVFARTP
jgi:hypothetical protein